MNSVADALLDALHRSDPVLNGFGAAIAAGLLLALFVLLPAEERRRARAPFWLLVVHLLLALVLIVIPPKHASERLIQLLSVFLILASIGRSGFLLFVDAFWVRRFAQPVPQILRDVIQAFVYAGIALLVLRSAGVEPGSLLTTSALLTAVIGLSLQDTLGNLFAGLAIQAQRPFDVGDWVQFDQQTVHIGKVIEINWRATRVLTLEKIEVTVPNASVAKAPILNFSRPTAVVRRDVQVVAPYSASPELVRRVLMTAVQHVPMVRSEPKPLIMTEDYTERGILFIVRYFIDDFERRELIESDVRERLWYALRREGLEIPAPRRHIELAPRVLAKTRAAMLEVEAERLLSQVDFFKLLPAEQAGLLSRACRRKSFASEELIVRRGESGTEMYLVESGRVRIETKGPDGSPKTVAELRRGDFFGEMGLMTGEARAADVIAEEETSVLVLGRDALAPVLESEPALAEHISRVLAERRSRLSELQGKVEAKEEIEDKDELLARIRRFFSL